MHRRTPPLVVCAGAVLLLLGSGCAGLVQPDTAHPRSSGPGGAIVIPGERLKLGAYNNLLDGIKGEVASIRVSRRTGRCPEINFRGVKTFLADQNAKIYIDGSAFSDTCILDQVGVRDVARVEVYPNGNTMRPGYRPDPNGLILIFTGTP